MLIINLKSMIIELDASRLIDLTATMYADMKSGSDNKPSKQPLYTENA